MKKSAISIKRILMQSVNRVEKMFFLTVFKDEFAVYEHNMNKRFVVRFPLRRAVQIKITGFWYVDVVCAGRLVTKFWNYLLSLF
jgi:hypothetical protein